MPLISAQIKIMFNNAFKIKKMCSRVNCFIRVVTTILIFLRSVLNHSTVKVRSSNVKYVPVFVDSVF